MNYQQIIDYLDHLGHEVLAAHYQLGRIERLLAELDHPERAFPSILIAGTNGKGSVAAMIESMLRQAGLRTGLYTSPHLESVCERIKVAGRDISREEFSDHATRVYEAARGLVARRVIRSSPTYFEHVTATGFSYFREQEVDLAVLEVGLGGRLDATSAVPPFLSVITRVDFDHEEILGSTLKEITAEKAAIIQPGGQAVVGPQHAEVMGVIRERCRQSGVTPRVALDDLNRLRLHEVSVDGQPTFSYRGKDRHYEEIRLALRGHHQVENAVVAIESVDALRQAGYPIPLEAVLEGLRDVWWPGRLEILDGSLGERESLSRGKTPVTGGPPTPTTPVMLVDGAHNLAGAVALRRYLEDFGVTPLTLIFGAMRDKPIEAMAAILFPLAEQVILTRVQDARSADLDRLRPLAAAREHVYLARTVEEALDRACALTPSNGMVCVAGSLYLVGDVKQWWAAKLPPVLVTVS